MNFRIYENDFKATHRFADKFEYDEKNGLLRVWNFIAPVDCFEKGKYLPNKLFGRLNNRGLFAFKLRNCNREVVTVVIEKISDKKLENLKSFLVDLGIEIM